MIKRTLTLLVFAASSLLAVPPAGMAQGRAPVAIEVCQAPSNGMRIKFTNESQKVALLVNFEVNSNGSTFIVRDVGKFSPGSSIDHNYSNGRSQSFVLPQLIAPKVTCRVESVRFVDKSVWPTPLAQAGPGPAPPTFGTVLSANPVRVTIARGADSALFMVSSNERIAGFREKDECEKIATVFVTATAQTSAVYTVKPVASGTCTAIVTDEAGRAVHVSVIVQ